MKTIYLSFVFTFIIQICTAQIGYFGKRNAVKFDGYFTPAFRTKSVDSNDEFAGLATTANFNISRIISNNKSLSLEYSSFKDYMTSSGDYGLLQVRYIRQNSIGVGLTRFRKSWIAPIGSYWKYSLMLNKNDVSEYKDFAQIATWYSFKLGVSYGYQRIIADKFLLDMGVMINFNVGQLGQISEQDVDFIGKGAPFSIFAREMFRFKIGFGYLF